MTSTQNTLRDKDLGRFVLEIVAELSPCSEKKLLQEVASRKPGSSSDLSEPVRQCVQELRAHGLIELVEERLIITSAGRKHLGTKLTTENIDAILAHIRQVLLKNKSSMEQEGAPAPGEEEEDILDLTSELGGLEMVEEVVEITEVVEVDEVLDLEPVQSAAPESQEQEAEPEPVPAMEAAPPVDPAPLAGPVQEMAPPRHVAAPQAPPQQPQVQEPKPSASQEAASELRRAIAALRAGQVPTSTNPQAEPFRFQTAPQPKPMPQPGPTFIPEPAPEQMASESEPLPMAVPMEEKEPEAETHTEPEPMLASEPEGEPVHEFVGEAEEPEAELVLTEVEMAVAAEPQEAEELEAAEPESERAFEPEPETSGAVEKAPIWQAQKTAQAETAGSPDDTSEIEPHQQPPLDRAPQANHMPELRVSRFGWLVENIPRRMRAHVPVEAEVRISSTMSRSLMSDLVGQGRVDLRQIEVAQVMSLRLSAPKGGFTIEAQSSETQWVWKDHSDRADELAAWKFTLTPNRRGSNILRLTFSYKEIGANGLLADSTLPDRILDVIVTTNVAKTCVRAALWSCTLLAGAALGAYFDPLVRFLEGLYN